MKYIFSYGLVIFYDSNLLILSREEDQKNLRYYGIEMTKKYNIYGKNLVKESQYQYFF